MVENWQILLAIIIVGLSIIMPIYYSHQKKKKAQQEKQYQQEVMDIFMFLIQMETILRMYHWVQCQCLED